VGERWSDGEKEGQRDGWTVRSREKGVRSVM